jgi:opacity protein-like surface antigen
MKRVLLFFLLCAMSMAPASAQFKLGLKGGANFADLSTPEFLADQEDISAITLHWHAGLTARQHLSDRFQLSTDLLYSIRGFQESSDFNVLNEIKTTLSLHYLSLPAMIYFTPNDKISLGAGINLGYLLDAQVKMGNDKNDASSIYDQEFDLGLHLGFQFNVTPALFLDARYQWGLTSVTDLTFTDENGFPIGEGSLKNRVLQLSLGYFFIR